MSGAKQPRKRRDPQKIGDVIADLMARRGYAQQEVQEECRLAWEEVAGTLAKFSRATDVKRGVLQVVVSNSVVMQEMTFRKQQLVEELQQALPEHSIKDLRFRIGSIK